MIRESGILGAGKMADKEVYEGQVLDVFSADDLMVMLDLGVDDLHKRMRIRLHGVDTPNGLGSPKGTEAGELRRKIRELCYKQKIKVTVISKAVSSWVAVVEVKTSTGLFNVNADLIAQGYVFKREK
jgi:endonuclease YncB( thermonuclease family)